MSAQPEKAWLRMANPILWAFARVWSLKFLREHDMLKGIKLDLVPIAGREFPSVQAGFGSEVYSAWEPVVLQTNSASA